MHSNFILPTVTEALPVLLDALHQQGLEMGSRAGRTTEMTHVGITLTEPLDREILCDFRKPNLAAQIAETMWVLSGRDDIEWLGNYLPRVYDFSDDGSTWRAGYGRRLRAWEDHAHARTIDQWAWVIDHLREQPASRRAVMSIWDPEVDTQDGKDIPCNDWLSFLSRNGFLDLHVGVRSNDVIWGWSGINQFEWSAMLEITAGMLGMIPGCLHFSTTSFHLYDHHYDKADRIRRQTLPNMDHLARSPRFQARGMNMETLDGLFKRWFDVEYDIRTRSPLAHHYVETFPEPMLQSWLRVIQWWWSGGNYAHEILKPLAGTRLGAATQYSVQPKPEARTIEITEPEDADPGPISEFMDYAIRTHNEKDAAYGDSWKKRGEVFSIIPNIARKVDRLGGSETSDETSSDTAMDLMIYLAKYLVWLDTNDYSIPEVDRVNEVLADRDLRLPNEIKGWEVATRSGLEYNLKDRFETLLEFVEADENNNNKTRVVRNMLDESYALARMLWDESQPGDEYLGADHD